MSKIATNYCNNKLYNEFFFWENKIVNNSSLWEGYFNNKNITNESKIIYTGIIHNSKNIFECGWAVYPDIHTLLGFIQHVFLPTSFFTWFDTMSKGFFIPVSPFDVVVEEVKKTPADFEFTNICKMEEGFNFLDNLWSYDSSSLFSELDSFCNKFNSLWDKDTDKKLFIKVFDNPSQVFDFIKTSLIWDFDEFIEEEIDMSLDNLKFSCDNVVNEPLLNRKFIDILNSKMPIMF